MLWVFYLVVAGEELTEWVRWGRGRTRVVEPEFFFDIRGIQCSCCRSTQH